MFVELILAQSLFSQYKYPVSKTVDVSDTYFGTTIHDPYRWLEDIKNPEVTKWFKAQADFTNAELAKIPNQDKLLEEFEKYDAIGFLPYQPIAKAGGKYFYKKRLPNEQIYKLYYRNGEAGEEVLLFDPQKYIEGKIFDYIVSINDEGSLALLNLSEAGTELGDIHVMDVPTRKFLPDIIPHSRGQFARGSNTHVLYWVYKSYDVHDPDNNLNTPFKLHITGTPVSKDKTLVSSEKNPELDILSRDYPKIDFFKNSPYMILGKYTVERNLTLYFAPISELRNEKVNWMPLATIEDEILRFFVNGKDIYFLTSKGNPNFKIIKTSFESPDLKSAVVVAEGNKEWQLSRDDIAQTKDFLVFNKTKNELITKTFQYAFNTGQTSEIVIPLEGVNSPSSLSGDENEIYLMNSGWTRPGNFYCYNLLTKKLSDGIFNMKQDYPGLGNIVYEEVEIPSWDGTLVPLSIVYDKTKLKRDGSNIVYMGGYGAYGMSFPPMFFPFDLPLLNRGVVLATAHVRGGGEKGSEWHQAGRKTTKPNTWKDFNACAEWLIKNKYTSADKFGIMGGSAGGILIGRAITERPDLYKVAIPKVGVMNTLRMEFEPNGPANIPEFGTVAIEEEFKALLEMDSYHHIKKGVKYPAQLITTGFNDPRVTSTNPAKFAARMQVENASGNPVFLYVNYAAGHGMGSTVSEFFQQLAKEYAFLLWQTGHPEFQPDKIAIVNN